MASGVFSKAVWRSRNRIFSALLLEEKDKGSGSAAEERLRQRYFDRCSRSERQIKAIGIDVQR